LGGASEAVKTFMEEYNEKVKKTQGKRKSTSVESRVKVRSSTQFIIFSKNLGYRDVKFAYLQNVG
jgi:hypothetical protein